MICFLSFLQYMNYSAFRYSHYQFIVKAFRNNLSQSSRKEIELMTVVLLYLSMIAILSDQQYDWQYLHESFQCQLCLTCRCRNSNRKEIFQLLKIFSSNFQEILFWDDYPEKLSIQDLFPIVDKINYLKLTQPRIFYASVWIPWFTFILNFNLWCSCKWYFLKVLEKFQILKLIFLLFWEEQ